MLQMILAILLLQAPTPKPSPSVSPVISPACTLYGLQLTVIGPNGNGAFVLEAQPLDKKKKPFTPFACGIPGPTWYSAHAELDLWRAYVMQQDHSLPTAVSACVDNGLVGIGKHAIYCANGTFMVPPFHPFPNRK
jgi:hypothetical protein